MLYQPYKIPVKPKARVSNIPASTFYLQMVAAFVDGCLAEMRYWFRRFWRAMQRDVQIIPRDRQAVSA